jgi:phosphatidylinositol alpha-mannosyltransferase
METNGSVAPLAPDASTQLRLVRALWAEGFDVVHIHEPLAPGASVTAMLLKSAPLVGTFHASGDFSNYQWLRRLCTWGTSHLDIKVAVSKDAKRTAEEWFDDHCEVLFNGVDTHRLVGLDPWPTDRRAVLFVGRHEERKGLETLLRAADQLPEDVAVWVVGAGPLSETLQHQYAHNPRIEWLGRVSDAERDRRLLAADVFCAPALGGESFGVVLLEAMAAGAAVVASSIDGYTNVATHQRNALLVPPGDHSGFANAISEVLESPALAGRLRVGGQEQADRYSIDRLAERYEELYASAISMHTGGENRRRSLLRSYAG